MTNTTSEEPEEWILFTAPAEALQRRPFHALAHRLAPKGQRQMLSRHDLTLCRVDVRSDWTRAPADATVRRCPHCAGTAR